MKRASCLVLFHVLINFCCATAYAACSVTDSFVRPQGWEIPGLKGAAVEGKENIRIDDYTVLAETLTPVSPATRLEIDCKSDGQSEERSRPVKVRALSRLSMNGHVFAYITHLQRLPDGGGTGAIGIDLFEIIYDVDGSGKFTERRAQQLKEKITVPAWARR
jgi:hypothetical protein